MDIQKVIKLVLSILLLICLFDMPYGYYQFVRLVGTAAFAFLAFKANDNKQELLMVFFISLALLFQPIIKVPFDKSIWNVIDVLVALFLFTTIFTNKKSD